MDTPLSIMCDAWEREGCIRRFDSTERTAAKARAQARKSGWVCHHYGDWCPDHNQLRHNPEGQ